PRQATPPSSANSSAAPLCARATASSPSPAATRHSTCPSSSRCPSSRRRSPLPCGTLGRGETMSVTSATLLERLRDARDADAWGRLVELYSPLIRSWAERLNVRGADADDLVQEVMAVVVRRFPEFVHPEKPGAFRGWLRAIAANCARAQWRSRKMNPTAPGGTDFGSYLARLEDPADDFARAW